MIIIYVISRYHGFNDLMSNIKAKVILFLKLFGHRKRKQNKYMISSN